MIQLKSCFGNHPVLKIKSISTSQFLMMVDVFSDNRVEFADKF